MIRNPTSYHQLLLDFHASHQMAISQGLIKRARKVVTKQQESADPGALHKALLRLGRAAFKSVAGTSPISIHTRNKQIRIGDELHMQQKGEFLYLVVPEHLKKDPLTKLRYAVTLTQTKNDRRGRKLSTEFLHPEIKRKFDRLANRATTLTRDDETPGLSSGTTYSLSLTIRPEYGYYLKSMLKIVPELLKLAAECPEIELPSERGVSDLFQWWQAGTKDLTFLNTTAKADVQHGFITL